MDDYMRNLHDRDGRNLSLDQQVVEGIITSPFLPSVVHAPKPLLFQEPTFRAFDGRTDPVDHLGYYMQRMVYCTGNDAALCRSFASSLGDKGNDWFRRLPEGKIGTF